MDQNHPLTDHHRISRLGHAVPSTQSTDQKACYTSPSWTRLGYRGPQTQPQDTLALRSGRRIDVITPGTLWLGYMYSTGFNVQHEERSREADAEDG